MHVYVLAVIIQMAGHQCAGRGTAAVEAHQLILLAVSYMGVMAR
jgi:hypothetical protein